MAKTTRNLPAPTCAEIADMSVLGSLPLLPGEDRADYERLRATLISAMKPADFMEMIWTNDIIYLEWEITRFRRAKANFIKRKANLSSFTKFESSDPHDDTATIIAINIRTLEVLDAMIAMMEQRRNSAYHQAEHHRANLGNRLRRAIAKAEDVEFRELDDKTSEGKRVA